MNNQIGVRELRDTFLNFFETRGHTVVPSSSTVPRGDSTLLFTNAGMNQFKDRLLGQDGAPYQLATSSQKCIRVGGKHNDLDNVGHTSRHITFFEMLGNFSFGDYFKERAIALAFEFSLEVLGLDRRQIVASVLEGDAESYALVGHHLPQEQIVTLGETDNFWSMGSTGPCGPSVELMFDRGESFGSAASPAQDGGGERFLEYWNLVFVQYNRTADGQREPLKQFSVDTGAGLERIAAILSGSPTVFETEILRALIARVEELSGISYSLTDPQQASAFRVIADHSRALAFALADGARPSNTERGYVLRKILRRAVRYGRLLGLTDHPFLPQMIDEVTRLMGEDYPELVHNRQRTEKLLAEEEESFEQTLRRGGNILSKVIAHAKRGNKHELTGEEAFKLKDTYGFPLSEIVLIAKDEGLTVNLEMYELLERRAKDRSKQAHLSHHRSVEDALLNKMLDRHEPTCFVGYQELNTQGSIETILAGDKLVDKLEEGQKGAIVLDKSPFYAEKGGQVGDCGTLVHHGASFQVNDCQEPKSGLVLHIGVVTSGTLLLGEPVDAAVDARRRHAISCYHSATHLLHHQLRHVLGPHVGQAGSRVASDHLRFDFTHTAALTHDQLDEIERGVQGLIWDRIAVETRECSYASVKDRPDVLQFFGQSYGERVRLVQIGDLSQELCGGTHVCHTGEIGYFKIRKEGSVGKGVRRIEAVLQQAAATLSRDREQLLHEIATLLKVDPSKVKNNLSQLVERHHQMKQELDKIGLRARAAQVTDLVAQQKRDAHNRPCLFTLVEADSKKGLTLIGRELLLKLGPHATLAVGAIFSDRSAALSILIGKQRPLSDRDDARHLLALVKENVGGSGGGQPYFAQLFWPPPPSTREPDPARQQTTRDKLSQALDLVRDQLSPPSDPPN